MLRNEIKAIANLVDAEQVSMTAIDDAYTAAVPRSAALQTCRSTLRQNR